MWYSGQSCRYFWKIKLENKGIMNSFIITLIFSHKKIKPNLSAEKVDDQSHESCRPFCDRW